MKRIFVILLLFSLFLTGCSAKKEQKQYTATFLTLFDTVTTVIGRDVSEDAFSEKAQKVHDALYDYHVLFDIYNDYESVNNLKTVNDNAGVAPVQVDKKIIDLILDLKRYDEMTRHRVNAAMGSVLSLWHEARQDGINNPENAYLPDENALREAQKHISFDSVIVDQEKSTVFITDPDLSLDVGAVAKGWAAEKAAEISPEGLLISVGGNVVATGPKDEKGTPWVIGIQDPDSDKYLHTIYLTKGSVVTSGDYQRGYLVNGAYYHHIIDPETLFPARLYRAVTVVCESSSLADALSTALFLLPMDEGQALLDKCNAEAVWIDMEGKIHYSPAFQKLIRT
ncbi:MAG: FAD:protein FMN transferase [Clostridia bacterium]|nr:FAD:protein FMN transferase [Clostridia bacterium]